MYAEIPPELLGELKAFEAFLESNLKPHLSRWHEENQIPRSFFQEMAGGGWLGFQKDEGGISEHSYFKQAVLLERLAAVSPGVAVAIAAHVSLGMKGLYLFGSEDQKARCLDPGIHGKTLLCLGNTELTAGSDVANVASTAQRQGQGWLINGTKAYVTNGAISDVVLMTAVSDPGAERNRRLSMFLVDLSSKGVKRKRLKKQVWIPSDLTRIQFEDVSVEEGDLIGNRGRGLSQVLEVFTNSRIPISALAVGTARGALESAVEHAGRRKIFGKRIIQFQAKAFEIADLYARIESARLMLWKACWAKDHGKDFRLESSMAKYLSVMTAKDVGLWAADLFGAASVILDHPIHKYPMDAWGAALGEGTQDIQKLIIFREMMKRMGETDVTGL